MIYGVCVAYLTFLVFVLVNTIQDIRLNRINYQNTKPIKGVMVFKLQAILPLIVIHIVLTSTTIVDLDAFVYRDTLNNAGLTLCGLSIGWLLYRITKKTPPTHASADNEKRFVKLQRAELFFALSLIFTYTVEPFYILIGGLEKM